MNGPVKVAGPTGVPADCVKTLKVEAEVDGPCVFCSVAIAGPLGPDTAALDTMSGTTAVISMVG